MNGKSPTLVIVKDYSDVVALQTKLKVAKHRSLIVAQASHELRTPLNGAISAIDMIKRLSGKELAPYVDIAAISSQFLLNTVNDILVRMIKYSIRILHKKERAFSR